MNIGRTIRVLHAEPVGDPRPGGWPAVPPAAPDRVTAASDDVPADHEPATVEVASPRG